MKSDKNINIAEIIERIKQNRKYYDPKTFETVMKYIEMGKLNLADLGF